jgi:predicted MFS family arabinose efflux permease
MSSVTFMGMLSELAPSGILPQMSEGLGVDAAQIGYLVGGYALASAIFAIPMISLTLGVNRKALLLWLLAGFAASNIVVALSSSYYLIMFCRLVGGFCAGILWPMIAAYGTRLVPEHTHGRAITVIMSGSTLGISIGLPAMTWVGTSFGWRTEFHVLGGLVAAIGVLSYFFLPSAAGERLTKSNSPLALLKIPSVLVILALTCLAVTAHYGVYTYVTLLVDYIDFAGGIELALIIFGVGSIVSVALAARYIDQYLKSFVIAMLATGAFSMALFIVFRGTPGSAHLAFFIWGLAFGPLVTMFQTAISKQVESAKDVATSVQSATFNFSIMIASYVGGVLLTSSSAISIVYMALILFVGAAVLGIWAKRTLRSSPA